MNGLRKIGALLVPLSFLITGSASPQDVALTNVTAPALSGEMPYTAYTITPLEIRTVKITEGLIAKESFGIKAKPSDKPLLDETVFGVGLAEGTLYWNDISGFHDILERQDRYRHKTFFDYRLSYFLKAKLYGGFDISSSYDTERNNKYLFRYDDLYRYYPTYGDDSTFDYSATNTQGDFYVKASHGKSYMMWGDYNSDFNDTELAKFVRPLYGFKTYYESDERTKFGVPASKVNVVYSQAKQKPAYIRFRSTAASLYYLKHQYVVEGSEKVKVVVEDKITGLAKYEIPLTRAFDYEIDYKEGRIILTKPVSSVVSSDTLITDFVLNGDRVWITASYEFEPQGSIYYKKEGAGFAVSQALGHHIVVGGTYVSYNTESKLYNMKGLNAAVYVNKNTKFTAEVAQTEEQGVDSFTSDDGGLTFTEYTMNDKKDGMAYSFMGETKLFGDRVSLDGYYKYLPPGFSQSYLVSQTGAKRYGGTADIKVTDTVSIHNRYDINQPLSNSDLATEKTLTIQPIWKIAKNVLFQGEYRHRTSDHVDQNIAGKLTWDVNELLSLFTGYQQTIFGKSDDLIQAGGSYRPSQDLSLSLYQSVRPSTGRYGTTLSVARQVNKTDSIYTNYTVNDDGSLATTVGQARQVTPTLFVRDESSFMSGNTSSNLLSLDKKLSEKVTVSGGYERTDLENVSYKSYRDSVYGIMTYADGERARYSVKGEYRFDKAEQEKAQYVASGTAQYRPIPDVTLFGRGNIGITDNATVEDIDAALQELSLGAAYRPIANDRLNIIAKYTRLWDVMNESQINSDNYGRRKEEVFAVEGIYDILAWLQLAEKGAVRMVKERTGDQRDFVETKTYLWVNRLNWRCTKWFDLAAEYRVLYLDATEQIKHGALAEIDYNIHKYFQLGLVYNFTDFSDDITQEDFKHHGIQCKLRARY